MNAVTFRRNLPAFEEELVLNACFEIGDDYRVLAMVVRQKGKLYLWEISRISEAEEERRLRGNRQSRTNRAMHKRTFERQSAHIISEINILGQELSVSSSVGSRLGNTGNDKENVLLIYFLQKGVKLGRLENVSFDELLITQYEIYEKENEHPYEEGQKPKFYWSIPKGSEIAVTIKTHEEHVPVPVHKRFKLKFGEYKKPKVLTIQAGDTATAAVAATAADIKVYIHNVSRYDAWEAEKTRFDDSRYRENFSEVQLEELKVQYREAIGMICPKGHVIPLIEYECDKDYQMQFYTSEYLRKETKSSNKSVIMGFKSDKPVGPLGYRSRVCQLEAVPADYEDDMMVELFMYYKIIPAMKIDCKYIE